jgi:hypothetical protein
MKICCDLSWAAEYEIVETRRAGWLYWCRFHVHTIWRDFTGDFGTDIIGTR